MDGHVRSRCENPAAPRLHTPLPPEPLPEAPQRVGMGPRNQARRLSAHCPTRRRARPAIHSPGLRLKRQVSQDSRSLRVRSIIVDGEAVWAGEDGKSDFDKLHSRAHDQQVFLYAFDLLELNGEDYRNHPLEKRKAKLEKLLARTRQGMRFSEHLDEDGETIFQHACKMGLEGIVSKRRDFPYRSGRCKSWVKVKNPNSPAMLRIRDGSW